MNYKWTKFEKIKIYIYNLCTFKQFFFNLDGTKAGEDSLLAKKIVISYISKNK